MFSPPLLLQRSPTFLAPGTNVVEDNYSTDQSRGAHQASLSINDSWSLPKLMSIESVMPSNHLILCRPLLLPPIPPSIRVFSNESGLHSRLPRGVRPRLV